jgi:hypothetical protein
MIEVKVTPAAGGETFTVKATSQDVRRWERSGRGRSLANLGNGASMDDLYQLSYLACRRLGKFDGNVQEYIDTYVIDISATDDEAVNVALIKELTEWREIADNVDTDDLLTQLDERIAELSADGSEPDPTHAGVTSGT